MTKEEKIKAALGEMMFNQIMMSDTIDQLQAKVQSLMPKPEALSALSGEVKVGTEEAPQA